MRDYSLSALAGLIFFGTKFRGPQFTTDTLSSFGRRHRRLPWPRRRRGVVELLQVIGESLDVLPMPLQCLERSILTWYVLNLHGFPASIKIGLSLTPLTSHAWVEYGDEIFGESDRNADLQVIAEFPAWAAA